MNKRANLVLPERYKDIFNDLSDKQAGALIKAVLNYNFALELATFSDLELKTIFKFFKLDIDFNQNKYAEVSEVRKEAGKKGNETRWDTIDLSQKSQMRQPIAKIANATTLSQKSQMRQPIAKIANAITLSQKSQLRQRERERERERDHERKKMLTTFAQSQKNDLGSAPSVSDNSKNLALEIEYENELGFKPVIPKMLDELPLYFKDQKLCQNWTNLYASWIKAYPAVNVLEQVKIAHAWEMSNPQNRKINKARFLNNWLKRQQDKGRSDTRQQKGQETQADVLKWAREQAGLD